MSLRIALEQIQLPSFWGAFKASRPLQGINQTNIRRATDIQIMRDDILRILKHAGKPVLFSDLCDELDVTRQSLNGLLKPMLAGGQVRKVVIDGLFFVEGV